MSRTARLPRRLLVAVATAAALTLAGCSSGQIAQTANQVAAIDGANGTVGHIGVRNALLASPDGSDYAQGASVPMQLYVSNDGVKADRLTGITSPAASSVQIGGATSLPAQTLTDFTGASVKITLVGLTKAVNYGQSVPVTFNFTSGSLTINVPLEIPEERTTGRPTINLQPTEAPNVYNSGAPASAGG
ncbi:copper chaperone PCu(A)C [Nakamurella sp. PAMC28650]|uniref:copper chaperone PCu(A)C n=1 Tax=Nakamurella sp. PAMC28650 TaxID=2762325 RepID=UPI00164ECA5F|nr:copper chaperone PCu(A)C [Nakamurella sp. PAMC28650]QNK82793.1 copper chaperone PCu(A)C [Nakamurella sp. PAMC28650]